LFGVLAILCLGVGVAAFHFYDEATRPNRTTPAVTLQNYLYATLHTKIATEALKYSCGGDNLSPITDFRDKVNSAAAVRNYTVEFDWTIAPVQVSGIKGTATVEIEQDTKGQGIEVAASTSEWIFDLSETRDGWRVCGANQIG